MVGVEKDNIIIKIGTSAIIRVFSPKQLLYMLLLLLLLPIYTKFPLKDRIHKSVHR